MTVLVRQGRSAARETARAPETQQAYSWPAPTKGWVANGNLAMAQPGAAYLLENYFPTATGVIVRRGKEGYATIGEDGLPVRSIFSYASGNARHLFGATDGAIYDITTITSAVNWMLSDDVGDTIVTDTGDTIGQNSTEDLDVYANTNGKWVVIQFQASDGSTYLRGVNGTDTPFVYDGVSFTTTPALTFPVDEEVTPEDLSFVWPHKNRHFFIEKESMNAWYLPVGQMGGELAKFPLGGQFKLGGSLTMGATWSRDTGSGLNAMCAFFSSEGEVAIYQGSNPGDAADWQLVGVFRIGRPLGPKTIMDAGGDLVVATDIGFVPLSRALDTDFSILGNVAVSENIVDAWNEEASLRSGGEWNVAFWSRRQMVLIVLPTLNDQLPRWLVANAKTRAWTIFSGWDATCVHVFNDRCFFGDAEGRIFEAYQTGLDDGKPYSAVCVPMFDQMGVAGFKTVSMYRAVFRGPQQVADKVTDQADYQVRIPPPPPASPVTVTGTWGNAVWGVDLWGSSEVEKRIYQQWRSAHGAGEVHAPAVQVTSGSLVPVDAELIRIDATFTVGKVVV